jgi:hypothetical protein
MPDSYILEEGFGGEWNYGDGNSYDPAMTPGDYGAGGWDIYGNTEDAQIAMNDWLAIIGRGIDASVDREYSGSWSPSDGSVWTTDAEGRPIKVGTAQDSKAKSAGLLDNPWVLAGLALLVVVVIVKA